MLLATALLLLVSCTANVLCRRVCAYIESSVFSAQCYAFDSRHCQQQLVKCAHLVMCCLRATMHLPTDLTACTAGALAQTQRWQREANGRLPRHY
jgi:hypothetical protein